MAPNQAFTEAYCFIVQHAYTRHALHCFESDGHDEDYRCRVTGEPCTLALLETDATTKPCPCVRCAECVMAAIEDCDTLPE